MMEPSDTEARIVIVSDLHLGAVGDQRRGYEPTEDFRDDAAFARFLEHLTLRQSGRAWTLVILGDLLDIVRTRTPTGGEIAALDAIATSHPAVFAALSSTVEAGADLYIVPGNHDHELLQPHLQSHLMKLLDCDRPAGIRFEPWIFHVPGLVYAEHGHQYHALSAVQLLLAPRRVGHTADLEQTLGLLLDRYLDAIVHELDPGAVGPTRSLRHVAVAAREQPVRILRTLPRHALLLAALARDVVRGQLVRRRRRRLRSIYRLERLSAYASQVGLPHDVLAAVDAVSSSATSAPLRRSLAGLVRIAWRRAFARPTLANGYLQQACRRIDAILESFGHSVPFYVFGHTHFAEHGRVETSSGAVSFFNAGTWTGKPGTSRTFLEIEANAHPRASLQRWDDRRATTETLAEVVATSSGRALALVPTDE
jgi:UDP-2,3-diacylglucosamine pyrophosphatase LpxH